MSKHIYWFALAAAGLFAAACSDNDALDSSSAVSDGSSTYMAVNIYMSSDAATRSSSTVEGGDFASGTETEYTIDLDQSIFLFYASDGSYLTSASPTAKVTASESSGSSGSSDYAEYTTSAMLVLGPTTLTPTCMVGILNDANKDSYKGMSLTQLREALFTSSNDDNTYLLMSNAVKYEDNSFSFATEISSSDICESESLALAAPVDMYVERAKARVEIGVTEDNFTVDKSDGTYTYTITKTGDNSETDSTFTYYYVGEDGNLASVYDATVGITIKGWAVNAYNKTGYVIKNYTNNSNELSSDIISTSTGGAWGQSWYSDFRIFWAVDGNYDGNNNDESWGLNYYSWTKVEQAGCSTDAAYYYEQTLDPNATTGYGDGQPAYAPTLLVAATVGVSAETATEAEDSSDDADDIYLWYGSVLYSKQAVYAKILSIIEGLDGISLPDGESISSITWETQEASKGTVTIKSITMSGSTSLTDDNIASINNNDFISNGTSESEATAYYLRKYKGGASYYQVPIQTYISSDDGSPYGLVRNTAYTITINSVTGIGAGVPDTEEELTEIPEKDKSGYLACRINVLAWRLSSQEVNL